METARLCVLQVLMTKVSAVGIRLMVNHHHYWQIGGGDLFICALITLLKCTSKGIFFDVIIYVSFINFELNALRRINILNIGLALVYLLNSNRSIQKNEIFSVSLNWNISQGSEFQYSSLTWVSVIPRVFSVISASQLFSLLLFAGYRTDCQYS